MTSISATNTSVDGRFASKMAPLTFRAGLLEPACDA